MFSQKKFGLPESLLKAVTEAMKSHTVPKTEKEKKLAALAEPKDKITHADVLTGRGVRKEETDLNESHFKVGDDVICKKSGMEGEVVKIDSPQVGKYYTVKQENGKMVKYAPDELKKEEDEKEDMKEAAGASKGAEEKFHTKLDKLVHKTFGHSPAEKKKEKMKEETELYELSKTTLGSYVKKRVKQLPRIEIARQMAEPGRQLKGYTKLQKKVEKGVNRAVDRMAKEEVEVIDEMGPGKLPRIDKKVENEYSDKLMKDFLARGGEVKQVKSPELPKNRNRMVARGSLSGKERMVNPFGGKSFVKRMGEEAELTEAPVDGVAAGSMEGDKHLCASKVMHKEWKEGTPLFSQHAEPSEDGSIAWYDVMFEHGIEKRVPTSDLEILVSESHMNHKKKGK